MTKTQRIEFNKWVKRNLSSLRIEYNSYGIRHDYDLDGVIPFQAWAEREYLNHMAWEKSRGIIHD